MLGFTVKPDVKMSQIEKSRVRRCLFGPPDHESLQKDLKKQEDQDLAEMSALYNFDFKKDVPLHGRYKWEIITPDEHIPECYRKGYHPRKTIKLQRDMCRPFNDSDEDDSKGNNVCHNDDSEMDILARPLDFSSDEEEDISSHNIDLCNKSNDSENTDNSNSESSNNKSGKILVQRHIGDFMKKRKRIVGAHSLSSKSKLRRLDS